MNKKVAINKQSVVPWLLLSVIVFMLSMVVGFAVYPKSMAAEEVMVVWQSEDGKVFGTKTELDIFNDPRHNGKKIVDPFTKGTYNFVVENRSKDTYLDYELYIESINELDIPLVFSIKKNGDYIFGKNGKERLGERVDAEGKPDPEVLPGSLDSKRVDQYTLEWEWENGRNPAYDDRDTNQFGNPAVTQDIEYTIMISAGGEGSVKPTTPGTRPTSPVKKPTLQQETETDIPETEVPQDTGNDKPPQKEVSANESSNPEAPPANTPNVPQSSRPRTGDNSHLIIWISLGLASLVFLIPLVFFKRKKKKEE